MAEPVSARRWLGRVTWLGLVALAMFVALLPLGTESRWPGPDAILALTLVWVVRRPDYVPAPVVAAVFLLADLLFQRPPGLMAGLVVILTEMLRGRAATLRNMSFPLEWFTASLGIAGVMVANRMVLGLSVTPQAPLSVSLVQTAATCLAYPVVVIAAHVIFGVRRPARGEVDALGHRL